MKELIKVEQYRQDGVKFVPRAGSEPQLATELMSHFAKYENEGMITFAIDLTNVVRLSEEVLVLFLEVTARLRRQGGELYIYNLHYDLLEDVITFNPKNYLAIVEKSAAATKPSARSSEDHVIAPQKETTLVEQPSPEPLENRMATMEIPYDEDQVYKVCDFVTARAKAIGFGENDLSRIKIAVYEACLNAIQHTRKMNPGDKVVVEVESRARTLVVNVYDRGIGFDPDKTHDYDVTDAASHRKTGGMGLHIIRRAMDEVNYQMDTLNGNKLIMVKHLKN